MKKISLFTRILCCYFIILLTMPASLLAQLTISVPTFPTTNTVHFTLSGTQSTNAHVILFTPSVTNSIVSWTRMTTGTVGQTTFDVTKPTNVNAFFAAGIAPIATPTVATPVFSPPGGSYGTTTNVTISCGTPSAAIYYTTNGSTPTTSDTFILNGSSVFVSGVTTIKAKAFASGFNDSSVASATYTINMAPSVYAGAQQIISSSPTTLQGVASDDGLTGGGIKFTNWTQISGPGTVTFGNSHQTNSTASFDTDGIYVLQLSVSDGQYTNSSLVTIAQNTTVSVSLDSPMDGSIYTVPTNFTLSATASCGSGSITAVAFYANSTLIGTVTNQPYTFNWKSVSAGALVLKAVASTTDSANTGLASSPVNVTVNWPTNAGQVTYSSADLQIPATGLPISVNRLYDTRFASSGSFGYNGKLDYEQVNIQKSGPLATGWQGVRSGSIHYSVADTAQHLITVSLSPTEQYYFFPQIIFNLSGTNTITQSTVPNCYNNFKVHLGFVPLGQGQLTVPTPSPSRVGMDDGLSGWTVPLTIVHYESGDNFPINNYEPALSDFTFTAPDGTKYNFDGNGKLSQHTDRNGNYLQYGYNGIVHSSGREVLFDRDPTSGNITAIYAPNSQDGFGNITGPATATYAYDALGNLTNVSRLVDSATPTYVTTAYAYTNTTFSNNVTSITDPRGIVTARYEYDVSGQLTKQYDAFGHFTIFSFDSINHRQITVDRLGNTTIQNYTPAGLLASVQEANGASTSYAYDEQGRKIAETNALGQVTTYGHDDNDNVTQVTDPIGSSSSATFDNYGQPLVTIDDVGNGTTNSYDANGNLLFITNALNIVTAFGYDSQGNQIAITNALDLPEEVILTNGFDAFGDITSTATLNALLSALNSSSYTFDANGNKLTQTSIRTTTGGPLTMLTQWIYDAQNRPTAIVDALNGTNFTVYNGIGKISKTVDALNHTNIFYYDGNGMLTNTTFADGLSESIVYDAEQREIATTDRSGRSTSYGYDALGHLTLTIYPDGTHLSSIYDLAGQFKYSTLAPPSSGMNPPSSFVFSDKYGYDVSGRQVAVTNVLNQVTMFGYDANGNQTNIVNPLNQTNTFVYDALNRLEAKIYPDGTSESYGYDGIGRKFAVTNQAGIVTLSGFDALGRLTSVTNNAGGPAQAVSRFVYDEAANLVQQIDAQNRTNFFEYDNLGRRTKQTLPGSQISTFGYDAVGNLIRQTNFNNVVITNQYDAVNRLTNKTSIGGYKISYAYSPTGLRTNMVDASGTNVYSYDNLDRLVTKITPQGTIYYTYDGSGNLATIQSATIGGVSLTYGHDALNRVTNVIDGFTNSTSYGFDAAGNIQTVQLPNRVTNSYSYDALNRLTNLTAKSSAGTLASFAYKVAVAGNRTNLIEALNGVNRTNAWRYDNRYRLTNEVIAASGGPTGSITNKYDSVGNRTNRLSSVSGIANQTLSFNSNDQITTDVYDANGNTRTNGSNIFVYDVENRLISATLGSTNISLVYDGDGNRVRKIVGTITNYFLVDDLNPSGYAQVLEEKSGTNLTRVYSYGLSLISQRDAATTFYGYDGNGNTRYLTGTNAVISDTYTYDSYGVLIASSGTTTNFYRYSGEQFDPQLGLYYLRARYLNPDTGRFWNRDSFEGHPEDPKSLHRYTYGEGDPIDNTDPSGNDIGAVDLNGFLDSFGSPVLSRVKATAVATAKLMLSKSEPALMLERVFINETKGPQEEGFNKAQAVRGIKAIGAVIYNRAHAAQLGFSSVTYPTTLLGVVTDKGQFRSFGNYNPGVASGGLNAGILDRIESFVSGANDASDKNYLKFFALITQAKATAQNVINGSIVDPFSPNYTFAFRTANKGSPGGSFKFLGTISGNSFYGFARPKKPAAN